MSLEKALEQNTAALAAFSQLLEAALARIEAPATEKPAKVKPAAKVEKAEPAVKVEIKSIDDLIPKFKELMNADMATARDVLKRFGVKKLTDITDPDVVKQVAFVLGV